MKRIIFVMSLLAAVGISTAVAQDVTVDDAEGYADTAAVQEVWGHRAGTGPEAERVELGTSDGADGSTQWLRLLDTGFTAAVGADDLVSPDAGTYKLSFYYKNGIEGGTRWRGLKVSLLQNGSAKVTTDVNAGTDNGLSAPPVEEWTYEETDSFVLDGSPVSMLVGTVYPTGNGANGNCVAAIDQIKLIPIVGPALSVFPDHRVYLSGTETIVATPAGGSGTYTSVTFNVNGDETIEFTDTEAPYEFTWDTLNDVPVNTSRTLNAETSNTPVTLKVVVTDSSSMTKEITENYTIDNEFGGREELITNGDFSEFTDGDSFGANVPVGWSTQVVSANATFGPGESYSPEAGNALKITFSANDYTDRYTLRSNASTGNYRDLQAIWWGKGSSCRLYYCTSNDDGATFNVTSVQAGSAAGAEWGLVVSDPVNSLGLTDTSQVAVATHMFAKGDSYWDDISVTGNLLPKAAVSDWKLY